MIKDDFKNIINKLQSEDKSNMKIWTNKLGVETMFMVSDEGTDIYVKYFPKKTLTISRIGFNKQRIGLGTYFLSECKIICKQHDIDRIVFESVCTDAMVSFCIKHGFTLQDNYFHSKYGNYVLDLKK